MTNTHTTKTTRRCGAILHTPWTCQCILPAGHTGDHQDGDHRAFTVLHPDHRHVWHYVGSNGIYTADGRKTWTCMACHVWADGDEKHARDYCSVPA